MDFYAPLDAELKEIRLLYVDTAQTDESGRLRCYLDRASLQDSTTPWYEAISWCWGSHLTTREILLNNSIYKISANAEEVLRRICFDRKHPVVWLDAICINQLDTAERSQQVAIMREVYSLAERVLIWLGEENQHTKDGLNAIGTIRTQCWDVMSSSSDFNTTFWEFDGRMKYSSAALPNCDFAAIMRFFSASWFTRLWVVQEVMLGQESVCYYGRFAIAWADLSLVAQWLWFRRYRGSQYCGVEVPGIENASQIFRYTHRGYDFMNLLDMSIKLKSSISLDKVYGIHGLLRTEKDELDELPTTTDYNADLHNVFVSATWTAIQQRRGRQDQLDILRFAQSLTSQSDCSDRLTPSWVPRYDWAFDTERGSALSLRAFGKGAANGRAAEIEEADDSLVLRLSGVDLDSVDKTGTALRPEYVTWPIHPVLSNEILASRRMAIDAGQSEEAFALTLTCGVNDVQIDARLDPLFMVRYMKLIQTFEEGCTSKLSSSAPETAAIIEAIRRSCINGRLFITKLGHIGLGPPGITSDDVVCVLFGGRLPFVLRRQSVGWTLIGVAYVHGIMEGEYVAQLETKGVLEQSRTWFDIH